MQNSWVNVFFFVLNLFKGLLESASCPLIFRLSVELNDRFLVPSCHTVWDKHESSLDKLKQSLASCVAKEGQAEQLGISLNSQ